MNPTPSPSSPLPRCPFCKKQDPVKACESYEVDGRGDAESENFVVICDALHGGCGSCTGSCRTMQEAIDLWGQAARTQGADPGQPAAGLDRKTAEKMLMDFAGAMNEYNAHGGDAAIDAVEAARRPIIDRLMSTPSQGPAAPHFEANGILLCKNCGGFRADHKPNEAGKPHYCRLEGDSPLTGEWRYNMGYLCCGTLRIFRADFDTPPSEEFKEMLFVWMVKTLNAAQAAAHPVPAAPGQPAAGLDLGDWTRIEIGLSVGLAEVPMGLKEPIRVAFKALRRLRPYFDEAIKEPADGKNYLPCVRCGATLHVVLNADKPCPVCGKRLWKQTGIHIPSEAGDIHISYPDDVDVAELAKVLHQTANSLPAMEDFRRQLGTKKEGER